MKSAGFIHLHNHSEYSLLDGMLRITSMEGHPSDFLKFLAEKRVPALAITDHGNMYGAMEFYWTASSLGIRPIIGCEVYVAKDSMKDKSISRKDSGHLTILVKDWTGYKNLIKLVSLGFLEGFYYDPRIDYEHLAKYHEGLIVLSGCLKSHIAKACKQNNIEEALKLATDLRDIVGPENFFLELMDHGIPEEQIVLKNLLEISQKTGIPVVATNDCHYWTRDDWEPHDVCLCISTNAKLDDPDRMRYNTREIYFKSPEEMIALFSHTPHAIKNTIEIAERCHLKIETGKLYLPHFEVPIKGMSDEEYLKKLCYEGLKVKIGEITPDYLERLKFELSVINRMGFASYFLIVMDFIKYARQNNIPVGPGRGSGAGSLVAYALDITRVDPIVHGLLFERFLNPDRKTMPDLDIDFSDEGRAKVIEYVKQKYGHESVANIITFGTIKARSAIKDVGRVMDIPLSEVNNICRLIPSDPKITLYHVQNTVPEIKKLKENPKIKKLFEIAQKIEGLKRHTSVHAAGVVITKEAVTDYVPLANRNTKDVITTQYDGVMLTKLGLLKVDFLGLRTLTVIESVSEMIRKTKISDFDIDKIPLDDKNTFKLLCSGHTTGIFQLESEGMRQLIGGLKPNTFSDIAALVALYRPGPIQSGMLDLFVERKHGRKKILFEHPLMEPILKDTYGTIVYQEQVMEIAKRLGNFSPGEAESLRKSMGKKDPDEMEKLRTQFIEGCKSHEINSRLANKIFDQMLQFAGYGFNKSHSVAYALLAYQTAYLKANFPLEFMASLLTSEIGHSPVDVQDKENKIVTYIEEAKNMKIEILSPDINRSFGYFSIETEHQKPAIRFALSSIKNVGESIVEQIVQERTNAGKFKSLNDLLVRLGSKQINKRVLESLAKAGAFDSFYPDEKKEVSRAKVLSEILGSSNGDSFYSDREQFLFTGDIKVKTDGHEKHLEDVLSEHTLLQYEKEVLGFYFSGHPLASFKRHISMVSNTSIEKILKGEVQQDSTVRFAGVILQVKKMVSKKGQTWAKFDVEDLTGSITVYMFPQKYSKLSNKLVPNHIIVVYGRIKSSSSSGNPTPEVYVEDILNIYDAISKSARNLVVSFSNGILLDEKRLASFQNVLNKYPGNCPVYFKVNTRTSGNYIVETSEKVALSRNLFKDIEKILGEKTWFVESVY